MKCAATSDSPSQWKRVALRDCCFRPEYGYTASATPEPVGPKFLRITDIQNGQVQWSKVPFAEKPEEKSRNYSLEAGDIVIARIGATTGKAFLVQECPEAVFASYLIRLRTKPGLLPEFLGYFLQTSDYWHHINSRKGGRLKSGVNIPILESLEVPLPPYSEQRAIARALDAVHKAKEARQRELALERERKAALMEYLFTHGTRGEPQTQTDSGEMPASWEQPTLEQVCEGHPQNGAFIKGARFGRGVLYVNVYDIYQNVVLCPEQVQRLDWDNPAKENYLLQNNDIIFVRSSLKREGVGQCCCVGRLPEPAIFDCHLIRVRPQSSIVDPLYLTYFFLSEARRKDLIARSKTTTMTTLNQNTLMQSLVVLPPLAEQTEISGILSACDANIAAVEGEVELLDELFKAMLEELMTEQLSALPLIEEQQAQ